MGCVVSKFVKAPAAVRRTGSSQTGSVPIEVNANILNSYSPPGAVNSSLVGKQTASHSERSLASRKRKVLVTVSDEDSGKRRRVRRYAGTWRGYSLVRKTQPVRRPSLLRDAGSHFEENNSRKRKNSATISEAISNKRKRVQRYAGTWKGYSLLKGAKSAHGLQMREVESMLTEEENKKRKCWPAAENGGAFKEEQNEKRKVAVQQNEKLLPCSRVELARLEVTVDAGSNSGADETSRGDSGGDSGGDSQDNSITVCEEMSRKRRVFAGKWLCKNLVAG